MWRDRDLCDSSLTLNARAPRHGREFLCQENCVGGGSAVIGGATSAAPQQPAARLACPPSWLIVYPRPSAHHGPQHLHGIVARRQGSPLPSPTRNDLPC